jgi:hypothetical protein
VQGEEGAIESVAARIIQRRVRGIAARKLTKEMANIKKLKTPGAKGGDANSVLKEATNAQTVRYTKHVAEIRAKSNLKGEMIAIQERFKLLFDTTTDAFSFFDLDGSETISTLELQRGLKRLGLDVSTKELEVGCALYDGHLDLLEFLRMFAWHDIEVVQDAVKESRLHFRRTQALMQERLAELNDADKKGAAGTVKGRGDRQMQRRYTRK